MGYVVKEENSQSGEVTRRGPFVTEQEAQMALANAVEQAYDFNPQLATANVRQEVEDAVRDGCMDSKQLRRHLSTSPQDLLPGRQASVQRLVF